MTAPVMPRMESLRLLPSVPITIRRAATTDYIDGIKIPKGTMVPISVSLIIQHNNNVCEFHTWMLF